MTHEELLKAVSGEEPIYVRDILYSALRAVVELHRPNGNSHCVYCSEHFACEKCGSRLDSYIPYPCPTIQAIEKELK